MTLTFACQFITISHYCCGPSRDTRKCCPVGARVVTPCSHCMAVLHLGCHLQGNPGNFQSRHRHRNILTPGMSNNRQKQAWMCHPNLCFTLVFLVSAIFNLAKNRNSSRRLFHRDTYRNTKLAKTKQ